MVEYSNVANIFPVERAARLSGSIKPRHEMQRDW